MPKRIEDKIHIPEINLPRIVVIGGGFAGIEFIKKLKNANLQVVLLDKHNYHTFQPLLYQVATTVLEPDSIAMPFRQIFDEFDHFYFRLASVEKIFPDDNYILTSLGKLRYDCLIIATGTKTNFFGLEHLKEFAMPLKSIPQALNLRSLLLQNLEKALICNDIETCRALMNIVIVGGGPTGVETAGILGELRKKDLPEDYPELNLEELNIYLVEMGDRLLSGMSEKASKKAYKYLTKLGVEILLNKSIKDYDGDIAIFNDSQLPAKTLIWAAGVHGVIINGLNRNAVEKNRYKVDRFNRVNGYKNLFAIGDVALMKTDKFPNGHPMVAPVAIQQGRLLGTNMMKMLRGQKLKPFKYKDKGSLATIGKRKAVADLPPNFKFTGFLAWIVWVFIHIYYLIGFRNKLLVLINWMYNYFSFNVGNRLIIRPFKDKTFAAEEEEVMLMHD
jgi:NADH:ubiquinone reductase (H+-translocating)